MMLQQKANIDYLTIHAGNEQSEENDFNHYQSEVNLSFAHLLTITE